jgi:hypothetical protein
MAASNVSMDLDEIARFVEMVHEGDMFSLRIRTFLLTRSWHRDTFGCFGHTNSVANVPDMRSSWHFGSDKCV